MCNSFTKKIVQKILKNCEKSAKEVPQQQSARIENGGGGIWIP